MRIEMLASLKLAFVIVSALQSNWILQEPKLEAQLMVGRDVLHYLFKKLFTMQLAI